MRMVWIVTVIALALPAQAQQTGPRESQARITVTGQGHAEAAPDMATVSMAVVTEGESARRAMAANSEAARRVLAQLKVGGIAEKDMQTSGLSLSPRWDNRSASPGKAPPIVGFVARNSITVRLRDLDKLGDVVDAVLQAGANSFQGLSFGLQEPGPLADQARRLAVADALRKAQLYTKAAGVTLGLVHSISETGSAIPGSQMMRSTTVMESAAVPIAQGEVTASASVVMEFDIQP